MPTLAVYPGSFDPLTNGHVDIIERGARLFDRIVVALLVNAEKSPLFTVDERLDMFRDFVNSLDIDPGSSSGGSGGSSGPREPGGGRRGG